MPHAWPRATARRLHAVAQDAECHMTGCLAQSRADGSGVTARRSESSAKRLHTHRILEPVQVGPTETAAICAAFAESSGGLEPPTLLTMAFPRQPVAAHGNAIRLSEPLSRPLHLPPVATGCDRSALSEEGPRVKRRVLLSRGGAMSGSSSVYLLSCSRTVGCSSLSWPSLHTVSMGAVPASQFHNGPSGGQSQAGACRDGGAAGAARGGLEGLVAGEHVPGGDQDLARDRGLGGVAVAGAASDVGVEVVPGIGFAPGLLGGLDRRPPEEA